MLEGGEMLIYLLRPRSLSILRGTSINNKPSLCPPSPPRKERRINAPRRSLSHELPSCFPPIPPGLVSGRTIHPGSHSRASARPRSPHLRPGATIIPPQSSFKWHCCGSTRCGDRNQHAAYFPGEVRRRPPGRARQRDGALSRRKVSAGEFRSSSELRRSLSKS